MANVRLVTRVDTSGARKLARRYETEAKAAGVAIRAANEQLARDLQTREANVMLAEVAKGGRPQRHSRGNSPLAKALRSDRNRKVRIDGFQVNDPQFLDRAVIYWRQLEAGANRTQVLRGFFQESVGRTGGGTFARAGARGGNLSGPRRGARTAVRFIQTTRPMGRGGRVGLSAISPPTFVALVGPARAYRYIEQATDQMLAEWFGTRRATNVYRRAFRAAGLTLMSEFREGPVRGGTTAGLASPLGPRTSPLKG